MQPCRGCTDMHKSAGAKEKVELKVWKPMPRHGTVWDLCLGVSINVYVSDLKKIKSIFLGGTICRQHKLPDSTNELTDRYLYINRKTNYERPHAHLKKTAAAGRTADVSKWLVLPLKVVWSNRSSLTYICPHSCKLTYFVLLRVNIISKDCHLMTILARHTRYIYCAALIVQGFVLYGCLFWSQ